MKPTNEWQRLVKKEKEGGGGEEWNDGPSATSKSKKSQSFPTSGSPVYRSLNQSAINWQAVPARLEGGTEHRWPVVVDPSFPISSRQNLPLPTDIHFSPWKNCRENEIHRASASSFSTAFLFTTRRSIRLTIFSTNFVQNVVLNSFIFDLIWQSTALRKAWLRVWRSSFIIRVKFVTKIRELRSWSNSKFLVGFSRNQEIIPRAGTTGPEKRSLIVAGRKLEGRSDAKAIENFSRVDSFQSLLRNPIEPRCLDPGQVLQYWLAQFSIISELRKVPWAGSILKCWRILTDETWSTSEIHGSFFSSRSMYAYLSPYVIISSSTSRISFPDKVFGKIAKMDLYSIFVTSNLLFLPLLHNSLPITLHRVEI